MGDYIDKLLDINGIDKDIFKQVNDWFDICRIQQGYRVTTKYDFDIGTDADPYVIYYLYGIMTDGRCMALHLDIIDSKSFRYWAYENKKVMYKIRASNYITKQLENDFILFDMNLKLLPNNVFLQPDNKMIFTYPSLKTINDDLAKLARNVKNNYKCKTRREFKDRRDIYIQNEKDKRDMFDELNDYLIKNDIKNIFDIIVNNVYVMVDMSSDRPIKIMEFIGRKCNIEGHGIMEFLRYQDKLFFDEFNDDGIENFALYDRNAIMATYFVKMSLMKIKKALVNDGPMMCEILLNNVKMNNELKQTFMLVNKYFDGLVKKMDVEFDKDYRVGCRNGCGNKIFIMKGSVINCLPKCIKCVDKRALVYETEVTVMGPAWVRCIKCICLFCVPSGQILHIYRTGLKCALCR